MYTAITLLPRCNVVGQVYNLLCRVGELYSKTQTIHRDIVLKSSKECVL